MPELWTLAVVRAMHHFRSFLVAGFLAVIVGCQSAPPAVDFHAGGWDDARDAKSHLDAYKHVFLACIYEDRWEDTGPGRLSLRHSKATVVKTYKGDWRVSDRFTFVDYHDFPALTVSNEDAGSLVFIFTNQHTNTETVVDAGDSGAYDAGIDRALQYVYGRDKTTTANTVLEPTPTAP